MKIIRKNLRTGETSSFVIVAVDRYLTDHSFWAVDQSGADVLIDTACEHRDGFRDVVIRPDNSEGTRCL